MAFNLRLSETATNALTSLKDMYGIKTNSKVIEMVILDHNKNVKRISELQYQLEKSNRQFDILVKLLKQKTLADNNLSSYLKSDLNI